MRIIYPDRDGENRFYFKRRNFSCYFIVLPTDVNYLDEVEYKCVRKITRALCRNFTGYRKDYVLFEKKALVKGDNLG
jgi:hypothetical protein